MKISSIDFLTRIDVLSNNVQNINMVTSHKYTKLVQSCINRKGSQLGAFCP